MAKKSMSSSHLEEALEGIPVRIVDAFNLWSSLCIAQSIPLGRLEWIWNNRGNSGRESSLTAKAVFRLLDPPDLTERSLPPRADQWFKHAYCHLLLVPIEELAAQRESPAWQYVRKFVEQCREKRFEYIVGVVADSETDKTNRKLMERVRTDVNLSRRERVVNVPTLTLNNNQSLISHLYHSPPHQELLIRLRECTRDAVEIRVQQYEVELERLYPKRANPDWSFCYFFSVKEAMGFVFCQLGRRDMALRLLDELHAFMVEYDEKEGTRSFCNEPPCIAAGNVSNIAAKDYPKLFHDNTITELEMRTYLFAIRTEIMLPDRKHSPEIAERGLKLITAVSRRCIEEAQKDRSLTFACFRDAWVFTAARNLATALSPAIPLPTSDANSMPQLGTPKERHTARLLAGFHVHALKSFVGLAKSILPGTMTTVKEGDKIITEADKRLILETLSEELKEALASPTDAELMYSEIANAAASLYEMGGRSRGAAALDGDAGVIRLRNGSLSEAEKLLNAQCSRYADDHSWDNLHLAKRKDLALTEKSMNKVQEYLVSCLTILFMTRSSRKISSRSYTSITPEEGEKRRDIAEKWVKEAYETARKLPRVMKYKAEKLLNVYMRPGVTNWFEGDPGKATVVIQSDIPADIRIDSLFVEFRNASPTSSAPAHGNDKKADKDKSVSSETPKPRVVTMKSLPVKLIVKPGINEMAVSATEIPWAGRYAVNLVALFIGKLKLVQVAPKPDSYPLVHIKGTTSQKEALAKVANSVQQPDIGKATVRFPAFFSKCRAVPASLNIIQNDTLFLVQGAAQRISVEVKSDLYGIDKDANIVLELRFLEQSDVDGNDNGNNNGTTATETEGNEEEVNILSVENFYAKDRSEGADNDGTKKSIPFTANRIENGHVEVVINTTVAEGVTIVSELSVLIPAKVCDNGAEKKSAECALEVFMNGRELASSAKRNFECKTSQIFSFINPIKCTSRTDLHAKSVTAAGIVGMDEDQNVEGGMLLCTIQSVIPQKNITLRNTKLELPHWLKLRDGIKQPHEDLLPFSIHQYTRFVFGFDVLVCGTPTVSIENARSSLTSNFSSRRYSRRSVESNNNDGIKLEGIGFGDDSPSSISVGVNNITSGTDSTTGTSVVDNKSGLESSRSADLEAAVRQRDDDGFDPMEGVTEDVEMTDADDVDNDTENADGKDGTGDKTIADEEAPKETINNPKSPDAPEVGDVVDLSGGPHNNNGMNEKNKTPAGMYDEECCGKLRLEFTIDGIPQTDLCYLDRVIHLHELRPQRYSYIIKRVFPQTVTAGENVEFCFCIAMTKNAHLPDTSGEVVELQYEISVRNDDDWIVSGRKRGIIQVHDTGNNNGNGLQKVSLLPLTSGRILMPTVQLYDSGGRILPENAYENLNECMQVVVLPSTHVTSVCVKKEGETAMSAVRLASSASIQTECKPGTGNNNNGTHGTGTKSNMPEVVAFESFFDL